MKYVIKHGNIVNTDAKWILHQVNCKGQMNSGVAKAIKDKWPRAEEVYKQACEQAERNNTHLLGLSYPCYVRYYPCQKVVHLFGQYDFGYDGRRYTSYDALYVALEDFIETQYSLEVDSLDERDRTIAIPWRMGCGRGGGNWEIVMAMIEQIFKDYDGTIEFWKHSEVKNNGTD